MKLNALAILSVSLITFTPISAATTGSQTLLSSGLASIAAQSYPGVKSALEQLQPGAGQDMETAIKQACTVVKGIDTSKAQLNTNAGGGSIFAPITILVNAILPDVVPALTAAFAVAQGDTSSAPALVALAKQACDLTFNESEEA